MREQELAPVIPPQELLVPSRRAASLPEQDVRLLIGGATRASVRLLLGDYYHPDFVQVFHVEDGDVIVSPEQDTFHDLLGRLPEGWEPTYVLILSPEYSALPTGLEDCPYPVIGVIGDWNLGLRNLAPCLGLFDYLLCDAQGVARLRQLGHERVHYWPLFSYDPATHRPGSDEKIYDITFIGNLNHSVQRERSHYLKQLAELSARRRVNIAYGVFGPDYARMLRQSKIVFNRSIRGELNMRAYEAPACGSLLFFERSNWEAHWLYREGQDCVYYEDDDLLGLLDHYLDNDAEREAITRSGTEKALASSPSAHFSGLLDLLERLSLSISDRPFKALPEADRLLRLARQVYNTHSTLRFALAANLLRRALMLRPGDPRVLADLGGVYANVAEERPEGPWTDLARGCFMQALELTPEHPILCLNAGYFLRESAPDLAQELLTRAFHSVTPDWDGVLYPARYGHLFVELEAAYSQNLEDPATQALEAHKLLRWQAAEWLGDLTSSLDDRLYWYEQATALRPDLAETQTRLGMALMQAKRPTEAMACFSRSLEDNPFDLNAMMGLLEFHLMEGDLLGADALFAEVNPLLRAIPNLEPGRLQMEQAYRRLREQYQAVARPLEISGLKSCNYLLFVEESGWEQGLLGYIQRFAPADDVSLLAYSRTLPPEAVLDRIEHTLIANGLDPDAIPEILVLEQRLPADQEGPLFNVAQGIYHAMPGPVRARATEAGCRIVMSFADL